MRERGGRRQPAATGGQATVELAAILPLLLVVVLIAAQLAAAGWALWSAAVAARAGARAAQVGSRAAEVARRALPRELRRGAGIDASGPVTVAVRVPGLVPGLPRLRVRARASLDPHGRSETADAPR